MTPEEALDIITGFVYDLTHNRPDSDKEIICLAEMIDHSRLMDYIHQWMYEKEKA